MTTAEVRACRPSGASGRSTIATPSPLLRVAPPFVHIHSLLINNHTLHHVLSGPPLPPELRGAIPARQVQFLAGRYCARQAIKMLRGVEPRTALPRTSNGAPVWPPELTGSITHTPGFASAAVAWRHDASGLGLDAEGLMPKAQALRIEPIVLRQEDKELGRLMTFGSDVWTTIVFSAKEALFKCLYPVVGRHFYYDAAVVTQADRHTNELQLTLTRDLAAGFPRGTVVSGCFEVDDRHAHALAWLRGPRASIRR